MYFQLLTQSAFTTKTNNHISHSQLQDLWRLKHDKTIDMIPSGLSRDDPWTQHGGASCRAQKTAPASKKQPPDMGS